MNRLTKRIEDVVVLEDYDYEEMKDKFLDNVNDLVDCVNLEFALEKLADYEDAEEQGTMTKIVRCKDCVIPHNRYTGCPKLNGLVTPPDFYCAFGRPEITEDIL